MFPGMTRRRSLCVSLAELKETILLRREKGFDAARAMVVTDRGKSDSNGFCRFLTYCHPVASSGEVHLARVTWRCLKNQAQVHSAVSRRE